MAGASGPSVRQGMQTLASWALGVFGATEIITTSKILAPVRRICPPLLACAMCTGFWVGFLFGEPAGTGLSWSLVYRSVWDGCAASAICWAGHVALVKLGSREL